MSKPLSNEDLAAIRARVENATPGPWLADGWEVYTADHSEQIVEGVVEADDAVFIAAAREDVPALLADAERRRLPHWMEAAEEEHRHRVALESEIEPLRALVRDLAALEEKWLGADDYNGEWGYTSDDVEPLIDRAKAIIEEARTE